MQRRRLVAMLGVAMAAPAIVRAAAAALPRVAFLAVGFGADTTAFDAIRDALRRLGEIDGQTYAAQAYTSDDPALLSQLAGEVVAAKPAVIMAISPVEAQELMKLTQQIPIVVAFTDDPVALQLTTSVARPSRNVTGTMALQDELFDKKVQLLGEIAGAARRIGVVYYLESPTHRLVLAAAKLRSGGRPPEIVPLGIASGADIDGLFERPEARDLDGVIVLPTPLIVTNRHALIAAEMARRLPAVHQFSFEVRDGALAAYGTDPAENFERTAQYTAQLLHGAKVADLPFQGPRAIRLALNRNTARALGLTIPATLLLRADEVVE